MWLLQQSGLLLILTGLRYMAHAAMLQHRGWGQQNLVYLNLQARVDLNPVSK